jgi:hypothetical protein
MLKLLNYDALARFLSTERLATYLRMTANNSQKAADLYIENLKECQKLYEKLHWLEIGLRNAINRELSQKYGHEWFDNPSVGLGLKEQGQIAKAKEHLARDRKPLTNGNMIAELSFGLWVNLFNSPYERLWRFPLRNAFAGNTSTLERHTISGKLHPILKLRNRIAHYEPILGLNNLPQMQQDMVDIVRWIEPNITELP